jgi:hypothetical protein
MIFTRGWGKVLEGSSLPASRLPPPARKPIFKRRSFDVLHRDHDAAEQGHGRQGNRPRFFDSAGSVRMRMVHNGITYSH